MAKTRKTHSASPVSILKSKSGQAVCTHRMLLGQTSFADKSHLLRANCAVLSPEEDVDAFTVFDKEILECQRFGGLWPLAANMGRGMLRLCISDTAKHMLLNNSCVIPHLLSGLLLEAEHPRNGESPVGAPEATKTVVQRDFAE